MNEIAEKVLELAQKQGSGQAEVFLMDSREMTIEVSEQKVDNLHLAKQRGLGLRVIVGQKMGFAYSADLAAPALQKTVERAFQNAKLAEEDEAWQLATAELAQEKLAQSLKLYDQKIGRYSLEEKIQLAKQLETAALRYDTRVSRVEKAAYQDVEYQVGLYNSHGVAQSYRGSYCGLYGVAIGRDGDSAETGWGMKYTLRYRELDPQEVGREVGEKAVRMLGAQAIPSGKLPVVFEPYVMTGILGVLQTAFSGEAVLKGKSFLAGQEGKPIASPLVNLYDHGALPGHLGSAPFDGEGVSTGETVLVQKGYLQGFLHNLYTAQKSGVDSTGNAVRHSFKSPPEVGITNFYLDKGASTRQALLQEIQKGFYVTQAMGLHTVNPISGDFSLGAAGLLIEGGELTRPVKGVVIAGNLRTLLKGIVAVADDLTFFIGKGAPTVGVEGITVSGN